jgi:hypothetical protein
MDLQERAHPLKHQCNVSNNLLHKDEGIIPQVLDKIEIETTRRRNIREEEKTQIEREDKPHYTFFMPLSLPSFSYICPLIF